MTTMIEMSPLLDSYRSWKTSPQNGKGLKRSGAESTPIKGLNFEKSSFGQ